MMKAATRYKYCQPGGLSILESPIPIPGENEILVKVKAATVNRTDWSVLTGKPWIIRCFIGWFKPKRPVTGTDFAGTVVSKGKAVSKYNVGDNVCGFFDEGLGSHAEYVSIPAQSHILRKPAYFTHEQAAAILEGGHYAFYFLERVALKAGDRVLVNGGTGAIGNAVLQFLKSRDAITVAVTCETDYIDVLKSAGADLVIDYTKEDFTKISGKFDLVIDAVGTSTFGKCKSLLSPNGIYITSQWGPLWQNPLLALLSFLLPGKKLILPVPGSIDRSLAFINELIQKGKFIPMIDKAYSLEQIHEAFEYVMSGQKKGNVVIIFN